MARSQQPTTKLRWDFPGIVGSGGDHDNRRTNALEYIAYYLDRIDTHLETIAESLKSGAAREPVTRQIFEIKRK